MSNNLVSEQKNRWCIHCKDPIKKEQKSITVIEDGIVKDYHKSCYDLLHPNENAELNFEE